VDNQALALIEQLRETQDLSDEGLRLLIDGEYNDPLAKTADEVRRQWYGTEVYVRGLIEFSNYCKNNCYYCGIRRDNDQVTRYRLSREEILDCADTGYTLGFRTYVLQSGEDPYYTDDILCDLVSSIKAAHPDCAVTLSLGERSCESYQALFDAGADRYLLRHETANTGHYGKLHPAEMSLENRKQCLWNIKEIGYEVGSGFMVGSPWQTTDNLIEDLRFLRRLEPGMIGIGPFIVHQDTPFRDQVSGDLNRCLRMISILRLMFPYALIPATTALGTINPQGRERGLLAGANVVMPNLSPVTVRKLYSLYDHKICTGEEAAECRGCLERRVASAGYRIVTDIGNPKKERIIMQFSC